MTSGIFHLVCLATSDGYVGSSQNIEKRIVILKDLLYQNRWGNKPKISKILQDWQCYGETAFKWQILEEVSTAKDLLTKKRYWEAKVNSVYNIPSEIATNKKIPNESGIYLVTNTVTGDKYVGATEWMHIRYLGHISQIREGNSSSKILASFQGLSMDSLKFEVLEFCPTEELAEREKYWINFLEPALNTAARFWVRRGAI